MLWINPTLPEFNGLAFINFKVIVLLHPYTTLFYHPKIIGFTIRCSSSIISKETGKKSDGVIGCDEQETTINPPVGLELEAVNILSVSRYNDLQNEEYRHILTTVRML